MKRLIWLTGAIILVAGCSKQPDTAAPDSSAAPSPKNTASLSQEQQQSAGIKVESPATAKLTPETKGSGRVVDPAALAGAIGDLTTAQAANEASQADLKRLKNSGGAKQRLGKNPCKRPKPRRRTTRRNSKPRG